MDSSPSFIGGYDAAQDPIFQAPQDSPDIQAIHPQLLLCHAQRQIIRDVMAGSRRVKERGTIYLPLSRPDQSWAEYERIKAHSVFFPATRRTAESKKGLMFAKNVVLDCPTLEPIKDAITNDWAGIRDMAEDVVMETLQTNFTGLLVDHPSAPGGQVPNARDAISRGFRPFIHVYRFEDILWIDYRLLNGTKRDFQRVVVRESFNRILELIIVDGVYRQRVWTADAGTDFKITGVSTPLRAGQPLDRIPFVVVSDNNKPWPQDPVLRDVAELNLDHYKASSRVSNLGLFGSAVVPAISGISMNKDADGNVLNPNINIATGATLVMEDANGRAGYMEPHGHMATALAKEVETVGDYMVKVGSRVLSSDKGAPEDATVVAMRNLAEDSATASLANTYSQRISDALTLCAWWMGSDQRASYTLNTDYSNARPDAATIVALSAAVEANLLDRQNFYMYLRDGGIINRLDTFEASQARIEQDVADRPPVGPTPTGPVLGGD